MINFNFPLGIAKGTYFCNRVAETQKLVQSITSCNHTLLLSPRRYGKTSLAYKAIEQCKQPHVKIDLYMSTSHADIIRAVMRGINQLIAQVSGVTERMLDSIKDYVGSLKPALEVGSQGFKLILEPKNAACTADNICDALQILDQIFARKNQKGVLLIDEFQEVERVAKNTGIEGAIRHVAQETQNFVVIFSGSKRSLLKSMFNDRNKPLYRLCDEIHLERIQEKDYLDFIDRFAAKKWGKPLTQQLFKDLVAYTECHPYYFNAILCDLFRLNDFPTSAIIGKLWEDLLERKRNDLLAETKSLTIVHKKLLVAIANGINTKLTGRSFLSRADLSGTSVVRGLEYLLEEDVVERSSKGYVLIDPLLKAVIQKLQII